MHVYRAALHVYRAATPSPHVSGVVYKTMRRCLTNKLPYWIRWSRSIVPRRRSRVSTLPPLIPHTLRQTPPPARYCYGFYGSTKSSAIHTHGLQYNMTRWCLYSVSLHFSHGFYFAGFIRLWNFSNMFRNLYFLFSNTFLEFPYNVKSQTQLAFAIHK